jgi:hypothetical protein
MTQTNIYLFVFSTHKEEVDKINLTKLATDFVLKYPKRESIFAMPE